MQEGTIFSLILASLRGIFSTRQLGIQAGEYEKMKPLEDSPLLHICDEK